MRAGGAVRGGVLLLAAVALGGCADRAGQPGSPGEPTGLVELQPMGPPPALPTDGLPDELSVDELDGLQYPPVTQEMLTAVDRLRAAAGNNPDSGGPEISLDRTQITLRWYGDVPAAVQAVVAEYATGPFTVTVEPTRFRPADLLAEASRLIEEHPGVVAGVGPRNEGDGIDVLIRPEAVEEAGSLDRALADDGVVSAFPLFPTEGAVVPA